MYDNNGFAAKWFHMGNHGNHKKHPYGKFGEHVHDFSISQNPKENKRDLTQEECVVVNWKESEDG